MKVPFFIAGMMLSTSLIAQDVTIDGSITQPLKQPLRGKQATKQTSVPSVKLLKIKLSDKARQVLKTRSMAAVAHTGQFALKKSNGSYPSQVTLGMNEVPVLNQGMHGSCVTFAITAALDAIIGKGDYVSQLCNLQLGNYLAENGYLMSGWDGSYGRFVLSQIDAFGIVNKQDQQTTGCGGLTEYPVLGEAPETSISLSDFKQISESVSFDLFHWTPVLDAGQAFSDRINTNQVLDAVKDALAHQDRVVFATMLVDPDLGVAGALGTSKADNDTWVLTPELARSAWINPMYAGHEMVITGYDDNAVAVDDNNQEHKGLLTLRNSWGDNVGDNGDFYMSYDYFKLLVVEAQRMRPVMLFPKQ